MRDILGAMSRNAMYFFFSRFIGQGKPHGPARPSSYSCDGRYSDGPVTEVRTLKHPA